MYLADKSGPLCGEGTVRSPLTWHVTVPTVDTYPLGIEGIGVAAPGSIPSLRLAPAFTLPGSLWPSWGCTTPVLSL